MYGNRVVVTGMGAISPIGNSAETYWENLKAGVSGVDFIKSFDASEYPVKIAAEASDFVPEDFMDKKASRRMARHAQFSVAAAGQAIRQSGLTIGEENAWDVGAMVATGGGGFPVAVSET